MSSRAADRVRLDDTYPLVVSGEGIYLRGEDGRQYLDALSGSMNVIIGYGVPEVAEAAISLVTPFGRAGFTPPVKIAGVGPFDRSFEVWGNLISPGWFRTFGTPVIAGRDVTDRDRLGVCSRR